MNDYLTKPISLEQIEETLFKWTHSKQQTKSRPRFGKGIKKPANHAQQSIDWGLCIKMAGGKEALAKEMLAMLVDSIPESREHIESAYQRQALTELKEAVHKFHGATCYVGVPSLRGSANKYETQLKEHGFDEDTDKLHQQLIEEMQKVEQESMLISVS